MPSTNTATQLLVARPLRRRPTPECTYTCGDRTYKPVLTARFFYLFQPRTVSHPKSNPLSTRHIRLHVETLHLSMHAMRRRLVLEEKYIAGPDTLGIVKERAA